jgi:UDP-N-acetylmuramoylalanine--D-glutamate ligase
VTGANGKSTTAAMIAAILEADGRRTWLGGNLGGSLLDDLDRIGPGDWVVLELSSFQLFRLNHTPMPRVAVVTNCTPNHLDWHGGYQQYVTAKQRILTGQTRDGIAVLGESLAGDGSWRRQVRGSLAALVPDAAIPPLALPGKHNRRNAVYAATAAQAAGCGDEAIRRGLRGFSGLPGRLQLVATRGGRTFYNDTTATTPESTIAALGSLSAPIWLLAGGSDKGIDLAPLASAVVAGARGAAFFGATAPALRDLLKTVAPDYPCAQVSTMSEALAWCWSRSRPGDCIVLSPACASHDQFQNFRHRGAAFCELVARLGRRPGVP